MATIALHANKLNQMPELIKGIKKSVTDYKTELIALKTKALTIDNSVCDLYDVISSIQASAQTQEDKIESLDTFRQNSEKFISDVIRIDGDVEELVRKRKEDFYEKYEYLKPECEKGIWEKAADGCKAVGEWCKEHWEILVVIAVAAVAIIAVVIFFPAAGPILLLAAKGAVIGALKGALFGALTGGLFSGVINWFAGESFWEGFKTGAISGALMGALFGGIGGIGSALAGSCQVVSALGGLQKVMKAVTYTFKISSGMASVMDVFDLIVFGVGIFYPSSPLALFAEKLHSSKLYNAFQFTVNAIAAFSGGAYGRLKQGPPVCFVAGTLVLTAAGLVAIENIKAGDKVISTNPNTFETEEKTVVETYTNKVSQLVYVTVCNELIVTTIQHLFYVKDCGFINAGGFRTGDIVVNQNGEEYSVEKICIQNTRKPEIVYNFQVEDFHTYHVGKGHVLVHNDCPDGNTPELIESGSATISSADRIKIDAWDYTPSDELYSKYKNVFDNPKYYNQKTGSINWPQNDGFASTPIDEVLQPGTRIDRYGSDFGSFTSPEGIPYEMRAVAPGTNLKPYSVFEVVEPINVKAGKIAPWFDEPGGGIQYLLPDTVDELLDAGVLRRINQ